MVAKLRTISVDGRVDLLVEPCQRLARGDIGRTGRTGDLAAERESAKGAAENHGVGTGDLPGGEVERFTGHPTSPAGDDLDLAGLAINRRWPGSPRGKIKCRLGGQQVTLWRKIGSTGVSVTDLVVAPDRLAGLRINGGQIDIFMGENSGAEIGDSVFDQDPGANRPARDHLAAGHDPFIGRAQPEPPVHPTGRGVQAPRVSVLAADVDPAVCDSWSQPDRSIGECRPDGSTGFGIDAVNAVIHRRPEVDPARHNGHVQGVVESHPVIQILALDRSPLTSRPGGLQRCRSAVGPPIGQRPGQRLTRRSGAAGVMAIGRPVLGRSDQGQGNQSQPHNRARLHREMSHRFSLC